MKNIVFLDDSPFQLEETIAELKLRGYSVSIFETTSKLFAHIEAGNPIDLFVLDVQLPEGHIEYLGNHYLTRNGLITGILVARMLRYANIETPIFMFSIAHIDSDLLMIRDFEKRDANTAFVRKGEMATHYDFADIVDELFKTGKMKKSNSFLSILGESIQVKPSFCGVGLDLKKVFGGFV